MSPCKLCGGQAVYFIEHARMKLCRDCFIKYYEKKVYNTVIKHGMLRGAGKIAVAVSGGKDSMALLTAMNRLASENIPDVKFIAIHINLGIKGYSEKCQEIVERVCESLGVEYVIHDLLSKEGYSIPDLKSTPLGRRICGACGTVKRYLMNKLAYEIGADKLATGHNLDDVVELLFEFYLKGSVEDLVRVKPVSWSDNPKLITKIKPLIELTEKENLYYALAQSIPLLDVSCPLAEGSRMLRRKRLIRLIEREIPGFKHMLYKSYVKRILPRLERTVPEPSIRECEKCRMPSLSSTCSYCKLVSRLATRSAESSP
jgi:uncharacterized protein (TIGR00269 family)